jgi:hypothetical protein
VIVKQMSAKKFETFLVKNDACGEAMEWYRQQPKRDLRSIVAAVACAHWLAWVVTKSLREGLITLPQYNRLFQDLGHDVYSCLGCIYRVDELRKKITVR